MQDDYAVKTIVLNRAGAPDIFICKNGKFVTVEVKAEDGRQSMLQQYNQRRIEKCGGVYILTESKEDFVKQYERLE
jgi:hypothetical protein